MQPTTLPSTSFESFLTIGDATLFTFYAVAGGYLIFTAIFYYHWQQYGTNKKVTWITYMIYLGTTLPLMLLMTGLALTI